MNLNKEDGRICMSRLEFWLGFFLFLFIALFIGYVSFVNAGNGSALTYVSFAATLISILLALVAMGYTYGESVAQRSKTDKVTYEISRLTDINTTLEENTRIMNELSTGMEDYFEDGRKSIRNTEKLLSYWEKDDIRVSYEDGSEGFPKLDPNIILFANKGAKVTYYATLYIFSLYLCDNEEKNSLPDFIIDNSDRLLAHGYEDDAFLYLISALFAFTLSIFRDGKLISGGDSQYILDEDLFYQIFRGLHENDFDADSHVFLDSIKIKHLVDQHLKDIGR